MKFAKTAFVLAAVAALAPRPALAEPPVEHAVRHVLVAYRGAKHSTQLRTKEEARLLAGKAREAIMGGRPFAEVSHEMSDDKFADANGGFTDFFDAETFEDPRFWAAVVAAKDGELVGPVETEFGFHVILRLSNADAVAILAANLCVVRGVIFPWKGAPGSPQTRSRELAQEDANRALAKLATARDFASLPPELGAQSFLKPQFMASPLRRDTLPGEWAPVGAAAFALKVGELSAKPIEAPFGWVILERLAYFRIHVEHLIVGHKDAPADVTTRSTRTKEAARARAAEALAKLKADPAAWPRLVAEYSEEPGAGERQGALGGLEPGAMAPEFEAAFLKLAPGAFSELVESPYGWHIIHRVD